MHRTRWIRLGVALADVAVLAGALALAWRLWILWRPVMEQLLQVRYHELWLHNPFMPPAILLMLGWLLLMRQQGLYDPTRASTVVRSLGGLSAAAVGVLVLASLLHLILPEARRWSRVLLLGWVGTGFVALSLWRSALLWIQARGGAQLAAERVAIFGVGEDAVLMAERLRREGRRAFHLQGFVAPEGEDAQVPGEDILGQSAALREIINEHKLETIVLAARGLSRQEALALTTRCAQMGIRVLQVPFTWGIVSPRLEVAELGELQLIDLSRVSYPGPVAFLKRAVDILLVLLGFLFLWPLFLLVAIAIKLDSPGPVLYASPRVGKGGRTFSFYKFRSMVVDADRQKDALQEQNEAEGPLFKMTHDPRITRVGRLIRVTSLDEFPQFWNVLVGDMNLVGPRPLPTRDLEGIEGEPELAYWFELRHQVHPGITGLWQVLGRSDLGFQEMVRLDIAYVQRWSPWLDLKILLQTIPAVLRGRGAR
ncbi:MAG: sugar transferase [Myxococcota bacterium]|nr:sugar transferase [Myxococcota bacterium]